MADHHDHVLVANGVKVTPPRKIMLKFQKLVWIKLRTESEGWEKQKYIVKYKITAVTNKHYISFSNIFFIIAFLFQV